MTYEKDNDAFLKYLSKYCCSLSGEKTFSLHKHSILAAANHRLFAPFCLYCVLGGHAESHFPPSVQEECQRIAQFADWTKAGYAYAKINEAYQTHLIQPEVIRRTKESARTLLKRSGADYKEMAAAGNVSLSIVYRFMGGQDSALSIETLFRMCQSLASNKTET